MSCKHSAIFFSKSCIYAPYVTKNYNLSTHLNKNQPFLRSLRPNKRNLGLIFFRCQFLPSCFQYSSLLSWYEIIIIHKYNHQDLWGIYVNVNKCFGLFATNSYHIDESPMCCYQNIWQVHIGNFTEILKRVMYSGLFIKEG